MILFAFLQKHLLKTIHKFVTESDRVFKVVKKTICLENKALLKRKIKFHTFFHISTLMMKVIEASSLRGGFTEKNNFELILMLFILLNKYNYEFRKWIMSLEYF